MKNLSVGSKLGLAFVIIILMFSLSIIFTVVSMGTVQTNMDTFSNGPYPVIAASRDVKIALEQLVRNVYRYSIAQTPQVRELALDFISTALADLKESIDLIDSLTISQANREMVEAIRTDLTELKRHRDHVLARAKAGAPADEIATYMEQYNLPCIALLEESMDTLIARAGTSSDTVFKRITDTQNRTANMLVFLAVLSALFSIAMGIYITRSITVPLGNLKNHMEYVGKTGDLFLTEENKVKLEREAAVKNEIGQTIAAFKNLLTHVTTMARALELVSQNDLTGTVTTLSDQDILGHSIINLQNNLVAVLSGISASVTEVSIASSQVASGSASLAHGTVEQSVVIEQLSTTATELSNKASQNADFANQVKSFSQQIHQLAKDGSEQMDQLVVAVNDIAQAGEAIENIMAVINNISYQTKILSLNAAIQAAGAGQYGRAFTVVADEVRSLAQKSTDAAENCRRILNASMEKTAHGVELTNSTSRALNEIIQGVIHSDNLVTDITIASKEQEAATKQISVGIEQVAHVVRMTSATAEQSATSSEEMSRQAALLRESMLKFKLKEEV